MRAVPLKELFKTSLSHTNVCLKIIGIVVSLTILLAEYRKKNSSLVSIFEFLFWVFTCAYIHLGHYQGFLFKWLAGVALPLLFAPEQREPKFLFAISLTPEAEEVTFSSTERIVYRKTTFIIRPKAQGPSLLKHFSEAQLNKCQQTALRDSSRVAILF
jgi:hypothetical protein